MQQGRAASPIYTEPSSSPLGPWPGTVGFTQHERGLILALCEELAVLLNTLETECFLPYPQHCDLVQYRRRDTVYFNTIEHRHALTFDSESLRTILTNSYFISDGPSPWIWQNLLRLLVILEIDARRTETRECAAARLCERIRHAIRERMRGL
jgi:hypothetical protein